MTISEPTIDHVRAHVHGMWAGVAPGWADNADYADQRSAALTERLLAGVALRPGDRVLELACGPGGAGLAAAERVGPTGEVVCSDVVPAMAAIAAGRGAARGLVNLRTAVLDLEAIDQPDHSFDVVLCREGLMFAVEPDRAVAEMHRVLRPGGRLGVAVWGPPEQNPWLGLVLREVTAATGMVVPPPGMPGPFALADATRLRAVLEAADFGDVTLETVAVPVRAPSFEVWWARTTALAGPVAALLARLDAETSERLLAGLRDAVAPYTTTGGLELPGLAVLATARAGAGAPSPL
jgi:ubiquinone/menaquinone biosynthesis C-methylase UbiE